MSGLVDPEETVPVALSPYDKEKITILPGASPNLDAATFNVKDEDHTLGNALRWMVMKDPDVEFCGYSMPHPSEAKFHIRIQMYNGKSSLTCLLKALANLRALLLSLKDGYQEALSAGAYEKVQDVDVQADVQRILEARRVAQGGADEPMEL